MSGVVSLTEGFTELSLIFFPWSCKGGIPQWLYVMGVEHRLVGWETTKRHDYLFKVVAQNKPLYSRMCCFEQQPQHLGYF